MFKCFLFRKYVGDNASYHKIVLCQATLDGPYIGFLSPRRIDWYATWPIKVTTGPWLKKTRDEKTRLDKRNVMAFELFR